MGSLFQDYLRAKVVTEGEESGDSKPKAAAAPEKPTPSGAASSKSGSNKGGEKIPAESREKEYQPEDKQKPFTYKPERPMELPQGVQEIFKAFSDEELLADIEVELKKSIPNGKAYHIDEVFGTDEKGNSKLAKVDVKMRADLQVAKSKLYVVGGAVRDFLLGVFHPDTLHKTPKNYNLATTARPKVVMLILLNARPHPIKCRMKTLGVVEAEVDGERYEIETFREGNPAMGATDKEQFVTYSTPQRDAKRRDFRINSLRYDIEKATVEDDVGGFGDLVEKPPKLRPNDPEIFSKEPHVALRAMRLHGKINGGDFDTMDPSMQKALGNFELGSKVDRKRVRDEFMDGLKVADNQAKYIACYAKCGKQGRSLLQQIFPGVEVNAQVDIPNNTHPHVALAMVLKNNNPEKAEKIASALERAGFERDEVSDVSFLLSLPKYTSAEQVNDFFHEMNTKAKKLVPSAVKNYAKWAKLGNRHIIEKMLEYKSQGKYPSVGKSEVENDSPDKLKFPGDADKARKEKEAGNFHKFHGKHGATIPGVSGGA